MAQVGMPINGVIYDASEAGLWFFGRTNGVFGADENLKVLPDGGLNLAVLPGGAWMSPNRFRGISYTATEPVQLACSPADPLNHRIDRLVIRWNVLQQGVHPFLTILQGTASVAPSAPAIQRTETTWDLVLADIRINAGTGVITQAMITDQRANRNLCGFVSDGIEHFMEGAFSDHLKNLIYSDAGVHGIRFFQGALEAYDPEMNEWVEITTAGGADEGERLPRGNATFIIRTFAEEYQEPFISLEGINYVITNNDTGNAVSRKTNAAGNISLQNIAAGNYSAYIQDTIPNYVLPSRQTITLSENETRELAFTIIGVNVAPPGTSDLTIVADIETNDGIAPAINIEFAIINESTGVTITRTTNILGRIILAGIQAGNYTVYTNESLESHAMPPLQSFTLLEGQNATRNFRLIAPGVALPENIFKTSGNWVVPADVHFVDVWLVGGGAGSGTATTNGAGSGWAHLWRNCPVIPGETIPVVIGAGGTASGTFASGYSGFASVGGEGGVSYFRNMSIAAQGGIPGLYANMAGCGGSGGGRGNTTTYPVAGNGGYDGANGAAQWGATGGDKGGTGQAQDLPWRSTINPYDKKQYAGGGGGGGSSGGSYMMGVPGYGDVGRGGTRSASAEAGTAGIVIIYPLQTPHEGSFDDLNRHLTGWLIDTDSEWIMPNNPLWDGVDIFAIGGGGQGGGGGAGGTGGGNWGTGGDFVGAGSAGTVGTDGINGEDTIVKKNNIEEILIAPGGIGGEGGKGGTGGGSSSTNAQGTGTGAGIGLKGGQGGWGGYMSSTTSLSSYAGAGTGGGGGYGEGGYGTSGTYAYVPVAGTTGGGVAGSSSTYNGGGGGQGGSGFAYWDSTNFKPILDYYTKLRTTVITNEYMKGYGAGGRGGNGGNGGQGYGNTGVTGGARGGNGGDGGYGGRAGTFIFRQDIKLNPGEKLNITIGAAGSGAVAVDNKGNNSNSAANAYMKGASGYAGSVGIKGCVHIFPRYKGGYTLI